MQNLTSDPVAQPEGQIEVDEGSSTDSAYGDEGDSFTTSVTSSVLAYRTENGRRYHAYKEGSYLFPNDDIENDRLDLQHAVFLKSLDGGLCIAPVRKTVQNVLDVGTGTGIWAIDFADEHPSAQVIGTDLSMIQPSFTPPNLSFLIDDADSEWAFPHKFDFIHGRMLVGSLQDWPRFCEQSFKYLNPGGWLEMQDILLPLNCDDDSFSEDGALYKWSYYMIEAAQKLQRPLDAAKTHKQRLEESGFVDVHQVLHKWPQNSWAKQPKYKELGAWTMVNMLEGLQGLSMAPFTRGLGWTTQEVELFLVDVRRDVQNRAIHSYWPIYFVCGKKPESTT